ncbi:MAG: type II toxin-antitoxin system HicA family toxin [Synergistaceae bacterium]|nr:type II toxin-antitoxin system HicA family toxin [Synergistaceae bacterium]
MPELSGWSGREVIAVLQKMGFSWIRTKGSHSVLRRGSVVCIVPLHDELAVGTLKGVLRQAGISTAEFLCNSNR